MKAQSESPSFKHVEIHGRGPLARFFSELSIPISISHLASDISLAQICHEPDRICRKPSPPGPQSFAAMTERQERYHSAWQPDGMYRAFQTTEKTIPKLQIESLNASNRTTGRILSGTIEKNENVC